LNSVQIPAKANRRKYEKPKYEKPLEVAELFIGAFARAVGASGLLLPQLLVVIAIVAGADSHAQPQNSAAITTVCAGVDFVRTNV